MTSTGSAPPGDDPAALRVGDAERNSAVAALGEHMTTGRLDLDEYGTRSAIANAARTAGQLQALFVDLPAPHPALPGIQVPPVDPAPVLTPDVGGAVVRPFAPTRAPAVVDDRSRAQKLVAAASAASVAIALILFFTTGHWWWFLLIPLISSVAGSVWGDSWKRPDARD